MSELGWYRPEDPEPDGPAGRPAGDRPSDHDGSGPSDARGTDPASPVPASPDAASPDAASPDAASPDAVSPDVEDPDAAGRDAGSLDPARADRAEHTGRLEPDRPELGRPEPDGPEPSGPDSAGFVRPPAEQDAARPRYTWHDFELEDDLPRAAPHPPDAPDLRDGRRHCGAVEEILYRQWDADSGQASAETVRAIDRLAELPRHIQERLAAGLDGIYVGGGGVPDLDDMEFLRGRTLPAGRATWDVCAGAYGDRKVVVGDRPSPTPDVMMHEVGHALDDIDGPLGEWLSDQGDFRVLYEQCRSHLVSDFHKQPDAIGRKEFFADAFAAIASGQRPALLDMLGGDTRTALAVMLYFNKRYGI